MKMMLNKLFVFDIWHMDFSRLHWSFATLDVAFFSMRIAHNTVTITKYVFYEWICLHLEVNNMDFIAVVNNQSFQTSIRLWS